MSLESRLSIFLLDLLILQMISRQLSCFVVSRKMNKYMDRHSKNTKNGELLSTMLHLRQNEMSPELSMSRCSYEPSLVDIPSSEQILHFLMWMRLSGTRSILTLHIITDGLRGMREELFIQTPLLPELRRQKYSRKLST